MSDINSVVFGGRLTADAKVSYLPNGTAKADFSIAVNRSLKGNDGNWIDEASFFNAVLFGKRAEKLKLVKGAKIVVIGSLRQDRWQDNNGQNRSKIYIVADSVELMSGGQNASQNGGQYQQNGNFSDGGFQEDIPFN